MMENIRLQTTDALDHLEQEFAILCTIQVISKQSEQVRHQFTKLFKQIDKQKPYSQHFESILKLAASAADRTTPLVKELGKHIEKTSKSIINNEARLNKISASNMHFTAQFEAIKKQVDQREAELEELIRLNNLSPCEQYESVINKDQEVVDKLKQKQEDAQSKLSEILNKNNAQISDCQEELTEIILAILKMDEKCYSILGTYSDIEAYIQELQQLHSKYENFDFSKEHESVFNGVQESVGSNCNEVQTTQEEGEQSDAAAVERAATQESGGQQEQEVPVSDQ